MNRVLAVFILAIVGSVWSPIAFAQENVKDTTQRAYVRCLLASTQKMDDQRSDAATIALAIIPLCASEFAAAKAAWGKAAPNPAAAKMLYDQMDAGQIELATAAVLQVRKDKANSN
jgi:hypothetical protein